MANPPRGHYTPSIIMMPDHAPFLAAIRAAPDDDAPRLIYADWLDEHGQPERAEFIRVQIELAKSPADGRHSARLKKREKQLLEEFEGEWTEPLSEFVFDDYTDHPCKFRRGFVERVA